MHWERDKQPAPTLLLQSALLALREGPGHALGSSGGNLPGWEVGWVQALIPVSLA